MVKQLNEYVKGGISLVDFVDFISTTYYVDVFDGDVELLPFDNYHLREIDNNGKFR